MRSLWSFARNRSRRSPPFIKEGWKEIFLENRSARKGQVCFLKRGVGREGEERKKEGRKKGERRKRKSWGEKAEKGERHIFEEKEGRRGGKKGKNKGKEGQSPKKRKIWKNRKKGVDKRKRKWYTKRALFKRRPEPEGGRRREKRAERSLKIEQQERKYKAQEVWKKSRKFL